MACRIEPGQLLCLDHNRHINICLTDLSNRTERAEKTAHQLRDRLILERVNPYGADDFTWDFVARKVDNEKVCEICKGSHVFVTRSGEELEEHYKQVHPEIYYPAQTQHEEHDGS